jgi:hypothetical protein
MVGNRSFYEQRTEKVREAGRSGRSLYMYLLVPKDERRQFTPVCLPLTGIQVLTTGSRRAVFVFGE